VALDGDGSDELFGGYGTFLAARVAEWLPPLPRGFYLLLERAAQVLPTNFRDFSLDFKAKSFLRGLGYPLAQRNQIWLGSFSDQNLRELLTPASQKYTKDLFSDLDELAEEAARLDTLDAVSLLNLHHYLHNDILVKLDRATMLRSLEARTPFLDIDVADFVTRLPSRFKRNKYILRQLMKDRIPAEIVARPKKGFGIPLGFWLRGPLYEWAQEVLDEEKLAADGIFDPAMVSGLLKEHRRGRTDQRKKLWTLLMWQLWYDHWVRPNQTA